MSPEPGQQLSLFATEIGGPMIFAFGKVLSFERKKVSQTIQSNGGKVIEYSDRNEHTIVLTKKNKQSSDEIQFDLKYIRDCLKNNKILPLEIYRLDKKVNVGCYYSAPFGSKKCIYSNLIQKGSCKTHDNVPTDETAEKADDNSDDEAKTSQKLKFIEELIYMERKPQVKAEPDTQDYSMEVEVVQESQSFVDDDDESQSLLRRN